MIWTDESSVMLDPYSQRCYRKIGKPRKHKPRAKHPAKVHVWGGISPRGATPVVLFTAIMTSTKYVRILEAGLIPFINEVFPDSHRFQQDNDPKHCSKYTRKKLVEYSINWWPTPAESPDCNPTENVWASMKAFLRNGVLGKKKLDPKRIVRIKEATFQTYPLETGETIVGAWALCIKSIDESCRRLNRIPKGKEN